MRAKLQRKAMYGLHACRVHGRRRPMHATSCRSRSSRFCDRCMPVRLRSHTDHHGNRKMLTIRYGRLECISGDVARTFLHAAAASMRLGTRQRSALAVRRIGSVTCAYSRSRNVGNLLTRTARDRFRIVRNLPGVFIG